MPYWAKNLISKLANGKLVRIFAPRTYKNHYGRNKI